MTDATIRLEVERDIEWWRPLVQWFLCIPHLVWTGVLVVVSSLAAIAIGIAVLVSGRVPKRLGGLVVLSLRERVRTYGYFFVLRRSSPPFASALTEVDPGDDPLTEVTIVVPEQLPRWAILRGVLVLPHILVLGPIGLALDVGYPFLMVLVAMRRRWPPALERFLLGVERWVAAVIAYVLLVSDEAPRFGLSAYADAAQVPLAGGRSSMP